MPKRARNDGKSPAAVYPPGEPYAKPLDVVEPGKHLSGDLPQKFHEEIGAMDGWSLVNYTPAAKPSPKKED